jgi:nucleoid-associated protein YgaU
MRTIIVASGTLFAVAAQYLGDATQWNRIASLNSIQDPWLSGLTTLEIPDLDLTASGGVGIE